MKRMVVALLSIVAGAGMLAAQENPLSSELQQSWARTRNNLIGAAEKMAEENYSYKPAPESQSFKDLVAHTADSAMGVCSGYNGEPRKLGAAAKTSKADLVAALKESLAECDKAYSSFTDAKATEMIDSRGGKRSRLGVLYGNTIHLEHEYAQMAVHLRLKGVVPPSSERRRP
jgi:hypothetical protein